MAAGRRAVRGSGNPPPDGGNCVSGRWARSECERHCRPSTRTDPSRRSSLRTPASLTASSSSSGSRSSSRFETAPTASRGCSHRASPAVWMISGLSFPEAITGRALSRLLVFIRLWRKLRGACGKGYSFEELADICAVLQLFSGLHHQPGLRPPAGRVPDAARHLRAEARRPPRPACAGRTGADRLHILALWVGPTAKKWDWAVHQLLERVQHHARTEYHRPHRPELIKLLRENLDPLSVLAGFDPATPPTLGTRSRRTRCASPRCWRRSRPRISAWARSCSSFTADPHLDGDDPFPLQERNEALDSPLELPDDEPEFSLWKLRHKLLEVHVDDDEASHWTWPRIAHALQREFGFQHADVMALGEHFFPHVADGVGTSRLAVEPALCHGSGRGGHRTADVEHAAGGTLQLRVRQRDACGPCCRCADGEVIEQFAHLRPLSADGAAGRSGPLLRSAANAGHVCAAVRELRRGRAASDRAPRTRALDLVPAPVRALPQTLSPHRRASDRARRGGHRAGSIPKARTSRSLLLRHLFADENLRDLVVGERQRPRAGRDLDAATGGARSRRFSA